MMMPNETASAMSTATDVSARPCTDTEMPTVENTNFGGIMPTHRSSEKLKFLRPWLNIFYWLAYNTQCTKCTTCTKLFFFMFVSLIH